MTTKPQNGGSQKGSSLIMLIGIIATLAILASAIVMLTANVLHNTAGHRDESKSFNVAEAGLDAGQAAAWVSWPTVDTTPTLPGDFMAQFPASEFPRPSSGQPVSVTYHDDDNSGVTSPGMVTSAHAHGDINKNNLMWIVSQANIAGRSTKVMALVEKLDYTLTIKDRVALYTDSDLTTKGTGNQPVVGVDPPPDNPPAGYASAYSKGNVSTNGQTDLSGVAVNPPDAATTTMSSIFPDEILLALIEKAQGEGRYFANTSQIPMTTAFWSSAPRLVIAENGDLDLKDIPTTDTDANGAASIWNANNPGILILLNGNVTCSGQKVKLYGIVYLMGGLLLTGNAEIHGMVLAKGAVTLKGTRAVDYNADVISNLNKPIIQSVRIRPGTWRELTP